MKTAADFMVEFPELKSDDRITKARKILRENTFREVYAHDGKRKLAGYIDITDVLHVTATKSDVTIEGYLKDITPVSQGIRSESSLKPSGRIKQIVYRS